jgi:hypothetical protein
LSPKADAAFLGNADAPDGLLSLTGVTDGGAIGDDLDTLADAVVSIEADGGTASHIIAAPGAWGAVVKLKDRDPVRQRRSSARGPRQPSASCSGSQS